MPVQITVMNPDALNRLARGFGGIPDHLQKRGKLRSLLEEIRDNILIPEFEYQFDQGGDPNWEPIAITTAFNRRRGGPQFFDVGAGVQKIGSTDHLTPLVDRGVFRRSATAKARFHIKDNHMSYGRFPDSMWWALPIHELGGARTIPQRSWVYQTLQRTDVRDEIIATTWDWVRDRIDDALPPGKYI